MKSIKGRDEAPTEGVSTPTFRHNRRLDVQTGALWPTLPPEPDESPLSFASRLARRHGKTLNRFCRDLGIGFQALVDGDPGALGTLARLSRVPLEGLRHNAIVRIGYRSYEWRGEALSRDGLSRHTLRVCPRCLAMDSARAADGRGRGPYGRAVWLLRQIRTCQTHGVALVPIPSQWETIHDFAWSAASFLGTRNATGDVVEERFPSRLEEYLLDRISGRPRPDAAWLEGLGFAAVADTCETLGAVVAFGRTVSTRRLDDRTWHVAGDIGFAAAIAGEAGLDAALAAFEAGLADDWRPGETPISTYGAFHTFLSRNQAKRTDLEPVRAVVSDHVRRTTPVGPGDMVLGRRVEERLVHSIHSAAEELGFDVGSMRMVLRARKVIDERSDGMPSRSVLFDARLHEPVLRDLARLIPGARVAAYLDASPGDAFALLWAGIVPATPGTRQPGSPFRDRYDPIDLDELLSRLGAGAEEVCDLGLGICSIPEAVRRSGCPVTDVVRLVLGRTLPWVGRQRGAGGFRSILIRHVDVAASLVPAPCRDWSVNQLAGGLGLGDSVVAGLVDSGILQAGRRGRQVNGRLVRLVPDRSLHAFLDGYVWLAQLGREWGMGPRTCRKVLSSFGVRPDPKASRHGMDVYRRRDIPMNVGGSGMNAPGRRTRSMAPPGPGAPELETLLSKSRIRTADEGRNST